MSAELFDVLARMSVTASCATLLVLLLRRSLRRTFGAQLVYASWLLVPVAAAVMLLPAPMRSVPDVVGAVRITTTAATGPDHSAAAVDPRPWLLLVWSIGAALTAAWFALQQRRYLRGLGRLRPLDGARIVQSESEFGGPALVGAWRPRIVLPADFDSRYTSAERDLILAHERVHLRRGDAAINAFAAALRCLHWFNPLLHYAAALFRLDQELACDAAVIARFPEARRRYADAMLKVQLAGQPRQELRLPAGCRWPSDQNLKERIIMLKQSRPRRAVRIAGLSLLAGMTLAFAYAAWASQSPRRQPVAASSEQRVAVSLRVDVGGKRGKSLQLIHPFDRSFEIAVEDGVAPCRARFMASVLSADAIALEGVIERGGRVLSEPSLVVKPGEPFSLAIDGDAATTLRIEGALDFADPAPQRSMASPVYPPEAVRDGIEGTVFVEVTIGTDGAVHDAHVDHVEPESAISLGDAAVAAVKSHQFARLEGATSARKILVPIKFSLHGADARMPSQAGPVALHIAADAER